MNTYADPTQIARPVWIGFEESEAELAEMVADFIESLGYAVRSRGFKRLPIADALSHILTQAHQSTVVWLMREDAPNRRWVEKQSLMQSYMYDRPLYIFRVQTDGNLILGQDKRIDGNSQPERGYQMAQSIVPEADFSKRCILIVGEAFQITGRGAILTPGMNPCHLVGFDDNLSINIPVEVRRPSGERFEYNATVTSPMGTPLASKSQFMLLMRDMNKDDFPPQTEIWLVPAPNHPSTSLKNRPV